MERFDIYKFMHRCVLDQLYAYCETMDESYLCKAFDILNSFDLDWIRKFVRVNFLDFYNEYWYHRKLVVIHNALVVMSQRVLHPNKVILIQRLLDCRVG